MASYSINHRQPRKINKRCNIFKPFMYYVDVVDVGPCVVEHELCSFKTKIAHFRLMSVCSVCESLSLRRHGICTNITALYVPTAIEIE